MQRREFFKTSLAASTLILGSSVNAMRQPIDTREVLEVTFPEKRPLIVYSDRPPLLETPRDAFTKAITPNDEFFVRWHMPIIPTHTSIESYRIKINGFVDEPSFISIKNLKEDYEQVEITAVMQCGGNSRSAFEPMAKGIQWGSGAMGCAKWKGVRLNDVLKRAGMKKGAQWIGLNGDDKAAYFKTPNFVRELELKEIGDDVIIAYEMNGEDLPYLNGYPVRLVIPGSYADSWVKMLSNITVFQDYQKLFFMDSAYTIPDNECECETVDEPFGKMKPITTMNIKSYIGYPTRKTLIKTGSNVVVKGVAFDSGLGVKEVFISLDGGINWERATLAKELSPYAFRVFSYAFKPTAKGEVTIMAKAVNNAAQEQPFAKDIKWNHGGYKYNGIDSVTITVH
jgi:sulfoxide reductase catalytic subunit YedY